MDRYEVEGHEVKPTGNGAHIYVPKAWTGATVKVVRVTDPNDEDE
jgi:putative transposon-encoded protein